MSRYVRAGKDASGGLGTVEFYRDANLDRDVAIKFLQDGGEHRRLLDELAALQTIRSKHVVEVFDVYQDGPRRMGIVEEVVRGGDLRSRLGKPIKLDEFTRLLYQVATGVADIHAAGIIHRDIKPANVMIDHENIVKIVDFNLARLRNEAETTGFVGTRSYAAPELYRTGRVTFGPEVDVYAMGVLMLALLVGDSLPKGLKNQPPQVSDWKSVGGGFEQRVQGLDPLLGRLLDACLEESPAKRPEARAIGGRAARVLLKGKHRATFVPDTGQKFVLDHSKPTVTLKHQFGSVTFVYDGLSFVVTLVSGEVWANNIRIVTGSAPPDGSVITFGDPERKFARSFVTVDVSHPEVVL